MVYIQGGVFLLKALLVFSILLTKNHIAALKECTNEVRVVLGKTNCDGKIEVREQETWRPVCDSTGLGTNGANWICGQLGFSNQNAQPILRGYFDNTMGSNYVQVMCTSQSRCMFADMGEMQSEQCNSAGVICQPVQGQSCTVHSSSLDAQCTAITRTITPTIKCSSSTTPAIHVSTTTKNITVYACTVTPSIPAPLNTEQCSKVSQPTPQMIVTTKYRYVTDSIYYCPMSTTLSSPQPSTCVEPTKGPSPQYTTMTTTEMSDNQNGSAAGGLGAFIVVQFLVLVGVSVGWIGTCLLMKKKRSAKPTESQLYNPVYFEATARDVQPNTTDQNSHSYEPLNSTTKNDDHTYAVIPVHRSKVAKKRTGTLSPTEDFQRRSLSMDAAPEVPPRDVLRTSICETGNPLQRISVVPTNDSITESQENFYHVLEQGAQNNHMRLHVLDDCLDDSNSETGEGIYHILEDGESSDPNQHMLGRISWSGGESSQENERGESQEGGLEIPQSLSDEWEGKSPATYEVPMSKSVMKSAENSD